MGLPIIFLLPLLAVFGVFGESREIVEGASAVLTLRAEYPTRTRYRQTESLEIVVENRSDRTIDTVVVSLDADYIRKFSSPTFIPDVTEPFEIEFLEVKPGESRRIWGELQGESYGRHRGMIEAYGAGSSDTVGVALDTIIFP